MHRFNRNNIRKNKLGLLKLNTLLSINMGFFNDVKKPKIKFNPKPFSNSAYTKKKTLNQEPKEKIVDLHLSLIKKIDELIEENKEIKKIVHDPLYNNSKKINSPFSNIIEIRQPSLKKPEMPLSRNELKPNKFNTDSEPVEEFFEIEFPKTNEKEKNEEIESWMINEIDEKKTLQSAGKIKIKHKNKEIKNQPKEDNEITKTKLELELTKKEIEDKKIALEKAIKEEKQKEIELKKIKEIKLKEEKLKKLEAKKRQKEEKIKQRKKLKLQKQKEKELKKQEKLKSKVHNEINIDLDKKEPEILKSESTIEQKKENSVDIKILDQDVVKLLSIIDSLFDNLPEEIVEQFAKSKEFEIYEKVMLKYTNK